MTRSMRCTLWIAGVVVLAGSVGLTMPATANSAEKPTDWDLLPRNDLVRIELRHPLQVLDHPLVAAVWRDLGKSRELRRLLAGPQFDRARFVVQEIEQASGLKWRRALEKLTAGGMAVSFTPGKENSLSLVVSADSKKTIAEFVHTLRSRLLSRVPESQRSRILVRAVHRNWTYYRIGKVAYAVAGNRFLLASREERLRRMLDRIADAGGDGAGGADLSVSGKGADSTSRLRLQLNLQAFRQIPQVKAAIKVPSSNTGLIAFLGGWLDLLRRGDRLDVELSFRGRSLDLKLRVSISPKSAATGVRGFFAESGKTSAAPPLKLPGTIYTASWYRDYSALWQKRKKLLAAAAVDKLEKGDKQIRDQLAVFGAKALPSEIFSKLGPHFRIAAVRQQQTQYRVALKSRLPAFVLAVDLRNESAFRDKVMPVLRGIGFVLAVGETKMLARKTKHRGAELTSLRFRDDPTSASTGNKIRFQFTPTYCIASGHFIVGSTEAVVKQTIDELQRQSQQPRRDGKGSGVATTEIQQFSFPEAASALRDFRDPIARSLAFNLGLRTTKANYELEAFAQALRHLGTANVKVTRRKESFEYRIRLGRERH